MRLLCVCVLMSALLLAEGGRGRREATGNSLKRAASAVYLSISNTIGEENTRTVHQVFVRGTDWLVQAVDSLLDVCWRFWSDLLDVMGIDSSSLGQYFSPVGVSGSPGRVLLLLGSLLVGYWLVWLLVGGVCAALQVLLGRFFGPARWVLPVLAVLYVLRRLEAEPERAVLLLLLSAAAFFLTGGARTRPQNPLEEKMENLDLQLRLLNIRLSRVLENLENNPAHL